MGLEKYGHFSDDGMEFIITRPDTPAPWVNYISNGRYTGLVSHTGGGFSYFTDPRDSRIMRFRYNCLPWDRPGRYVYLKDEDGAYWSLTWQPTAHKPDWYECRVGMGYQTISSLYRGIRSSITYTVPLKDDLEIWSVRLTNESEKTKHLGVYGYVELCLGHALVDLINQPNDQHFNRVHFDPQDNSIFATKNYWVTERGATVKQPNQAWDKYVFFTTDLPVKSWDSLKDGFIGNWRSEQNPIGIENDTLGNSDITSGDACAAIQSEIELKAGETAEFVVLMGITPIRDYRTEAGKLFAAYRSPAKAQCALEDVNEFWKDYLSSVVADTPDKNLNLMVNVWGKRQAWVTFNANRNAGYYHGGLLFGVGMRDQCQDSMGPLLSTPETAAERLCETVTHQFQDGSTLHNFFKLTGQGEKTGHSDTPLWIPMAVVKYLKETGDFSILNRVIPFQDGGEACLLDHACRAVDYVLSQLTPNHLPKFGPGDWNDTLDYVGRKGIGESTWVAHFLCWNLKEMADLLDYIIANTQCPAKADLLKIVQRYRDEYTKIAKAINERLWDGEWYIRGTRDDGGVIGSASNTQGRIHMNAQSWAVISSVAGSDRAKQAMDSADKLLLTERGTKILSPSYTVLDEGIGLATRCVPGKKENGAIFNHAAAWGILGNLMLGEGDRAYDYMRRTLPMNQAHDPDIYKMEPYVYSEYVTSDDHPTFGQASHSWLTGSAVWMLRNATDYLLGLRPDYDGLVVDPVIPSDWDGFKVTRKFRGATYVVEVRNPNHVQRGVVSLTVDGKPIQGNLLPVAEAGNTVHVLCVMG